MKKISNLGNISESEYRSLPVESYSSLKHLLTSPKDFLYYKSNPFKGSNSTLLGTAIHHYLQGNRHLVAFSVVDKRKKEEYAKFVEEFKSIAGDEGIIVPASFEKILNAIMTNVNSNPKILKLLNNCKFEVPVISECLGIKFKAKVDGLGEDYVLEIKSSSRATDAKDFKDEALERDYDLQASMYLHATHTNSHYFIRVATVAPFSVDAYKSSHEFLMSGVKKMGIVVERYKKYIKNGEEWEEGIEYEEI